MNEPLRATLALLEKLTLTPSAVGPEDIAPVRGVSNRAIEDAIVVCALFNIIDRLADAFEVEIPSEEGFARTGARLFAMGYL
jgi:alkylhydroperoxidase family enzyme